MQGRPTARSFFARIPGVARAESFPLPDPTERMRVAKG